MQVSTFKGEHGVSSRRSSAEPRWIAESFRFGITSEMGSKCKLTHLWEDVPLANLRVMPLASTQEIGLQSR